MRTTVIAVALGLGVALGGPGVARADEATLTAVEVLYHTNDDDKDHNTELFTSIRDNRGIEVATLEEHFGDDTWDDDEDDGPYGLTVTGRGTWSSMKGGRLVIRIHPQGGRGHDTWKFNVSVTLFFSDGERRHAGGRNEYLDQNRQQIEIEIV
ncbi:hypothetical protein [Sphaerisporangium aureirubrum]|uniref:PLAT domain-containing protein n=1 Tax=Sphaerisporangium aureirubrum TaxID=1544736 RepID=A0ABW1NN03_9ACTN